MGADGDFWGLLGTSGHFRLITEPLADSSPGTPRGPAQPSADFCLKLHGVERPGAPRHANGAVHAPGDPQREARGRSGAAWRAMRPAGGPGCLDASPSSVAGGRVTTAPADGRGPGRRPARAPGGPGTCPPSAGGCCHGPWRPAGSSPSPGRPVTPAQLPALSSAAGSFTAAAPQGCSGGPRPASVPPRLRQARRRCRPAFHATQVGKHCPHT